MAEQTPDNIITTQRNGQTIVAELFFNHSSTETFRDKLLKLVLADSTRLEGALWPDVDWPYAELVGSPEGDKLALIQRDATNGSLCRLSVIDFKKMRLFAIERDTKEVGNEHYADWFDNDTIMVDNNVTDETGHNTGDSWYYLYRIY